MGLDADLQFARTALQLGFIEEPNLAEAMRGCASGGLEAELLRRNLLTAEEASAIRSVVAAMAARQRPANGVPGPADTAGLGTVLLRTPPEAASPPPAAPRAPGTGPLAVSQRGGDARAGIVGTVALGRERASQSDTARLSASGAIAPDASRQGEIVLSLGRDVAGLFEQVGARAGLSPAAEDPDVLAVPAGGLTPGAPLDRRLFVSRKVTHGGTLEEALAASGREGELQALMEESRYLAAFRDACVAVAWAHRHGLVHRQLSPGAIVFGDHGELVVGDWFRARLAPGAAAPATEALAAPVAPSYRAPELAAGDASADVRSDVYALGGILYRILARRPPFGDRPAAEIAALQKAGPPPSPSALGLAVGRELQAACLKALAPQPAARQPDAAALLLEVETALAGGAVAKQIADAANAHVRAGREAFEAFRTAIAEARFQHLEARHAEARSGAASEAAKAAVDAARAAEKQALVSLRRTEECASRALGAVKGHREARRLKAELHWEEFRRADESGDAPAAGLHLKTLAQFNDGAFDVQLRGEGTLAVATEAYRCPCLRTGRPVPRGEAVRLGYHLASGRAVEGEIAAEGVTALEWARPQTLRVHGAGCARQPLNGADVWIYRCVPQGPALVPAASGRGYPTGAGHPPLQSLRSLFEFDSPFLASGGGQHLGRTPLKRLALPAGSYLLVIVHEASRPVRVPVRIGRCESLDLRVTLYAPDEIPGGFVQVSEGRFGWQGDRENPHSLLAETPSLADVFVARDPVTAREYAEFLNALSKEDPAKAAGCAPRPAPGAAPFWQGPPWSVPADASPESPSRIPGAHAPWSPDGPVLGVSWEDALHYCAWLRLQKPWLITLPHELEWEKAARGPDRRRFPWGNGFDPSLCNCESSHRDGARPVPVKSFPMDESPWGVRGLGGNSRDFCLNSPGADFAKSRILRGGFWCGSGLQLAATYRSTALTRHASPKGGFRLALVPSL